MFFIYNCKGEIVGNPKGYKTHKGAERQCTIQGRIRSEIFSAFFDKTFGKNPHDTLLYSIKWRDIPKSEAMRAFQNAFNIPMQALNNLTIRA